MSETRPLYVYGVVPGDAPAPQDAGIAQAPVRLVRSGGLAALVSGVEGESPQLDREALGRHAQVLEHALQETTVLPMRFGIVVESEAAARSELLERHEQQLLSQLAEFEGTVELKLRGTYIEDALMRAVVHEEPAIADLRTTVRGMPADAAYYDRIRLGEMVAQAVERRRARDADAVLEVLSPLARDVSSAGAADERIMLDASFLVARESIDRFDAAVDELGRRYAERVRWRYTGPLPPHTFVALEGESQWV